MHAACLRICAEGLAPVQSVGRPGRRLAHGAAKLHRPRARSGQGRCGAVGGEPAMTPRNWLRARAKSMRADMTPQEAVVWRVLRDGELQALNWRRQCPMGDYILD